MELAVVEGDAAGAMNGPSSKWAAPCRFLGESVVDFGAVVVDTVGG